MLFSVLNEFAYCSHWGYCGNLLGIICVNENMTIFLRQQSFPSFLGNGRKLNTSHAPQRCLPKMYEQHLWIEKSHVSSIHHYFICCLLLLLHKDSANRIDRWHFLEREICLSTNIIFNLMIKIKPEM